MSERLSLSLFASHCQSIAVPHKFYFLNASPVAQLVKNLPAMWETWVQSLG